MEKIIQINLSLQNGKKKNISLTIPEGKVSFDLLIPPLQQLFDCIVDLELSQVKVSCQKGCSVCCNQLIPVSKAEVLFLHRLVDSMPKERQQKIKETIQRIKQALTQKKLPHTLGEIYKSPRFEEEYFALGIPCPFLEDGCCSIYKDRPFMCREYHVKSLPSLCMQPYKNDIERVKMGVNFATLLSAFCANIYGVSPLPIPLFSIFDFVEEDPQFLPDDISSSWFFETILNALTNYQFKNSAIKSLSWEYIEDFQQAPNNENEQALPKFLTQYANAENIKTIFHNIEERYRLNSKGLVVEIGAGDGYLRHLMELHSDSKLKKISEKMIETENSLAITKNAREKNKILCLGIEDLLGHFGERSLSLIISMNVLDIFSEEELGEHLQRLRDVLKPGGVLVHIMSSAIHLAIFKDLAEKYPDQIPFPHYENGYVGVRMVPQSPALENEIENIPRGPEQLGQLFAQAPDMYVQFSQIIAHWCEEHKIQSECYLLHQFSLEKISRAMEINNFCDIHCDYIHAKKYTQCRSIHKQFKGANVFKNVVGALLIDQEKLETPEVVLEESIFGVVMARNGSLNSL